MVPGLPATSQRIATLVKRMCRFYTEFVKNLYSTKNCRHIETKLKQNSFETVLFHSVAPERILKWESTGPAQSAGKFFFWSCPSTFLALKVQLVVLVSAFVMVSTVWSVHCLLFYSRCPRAQPFVKVGRAARAPRTLWSRRQCFSFISVSDSVKCQCSAS